MHGRIAHSRASLLTIAALAERASVAIARRAREAGIPLRSGVPAPGSA